MFQKRLLRIVGINTPEELKKHNIVDTRFLWNLAPPALTQIIKILKNYIL
jgi:hypothetical protein